MFMCVHRVCGGVCIECVSSTIVNVCVFVCVCMWGGCKFNFYTCIILDTLLHAHCCRTSLTSHPIYNCLSHSRSLSLKIFRFYFVGCGTRYLHSRLIVVTVGHVKLQEIDVEQENVRDFPLRIRPVFHTLAKV